jgi:uncharacterized membrane protein YhiD involved in acid resistance
VEQFMRALDGSNRWFPDYGFGTIMLSVLLAFVLGQAIAWIYAWSHSGLSYSRSFTQSLILMTLIVSLVMHVIGDSIVTAFGLLGALALIRFRNVLKDTRDTVFVFIALVVGMAVGSQRYMTAIVGTCALLAVVAYLNATSFGTLGRYDGYLTCRLETTGTVHGDLSHLLDRFCRAVRQISSRQSGDDPEAEIVYQVGLRDRERSGEMLDALRRIEGVRHVSLVVRSELSEV